MKCCLLSLAGLLLLSAGHVLSYSYLMVLTTSAKSHFYVGEALAKGLVAAGHEVTLISAFPQQQPMKGLIDIPTPSIISAMAVDKAKILQRMNVPMIKRMPLFHALGLKLTRTLLAEPAVQQLLQEKRSYDAVICEIFLNEAQLGFAEHFKAPLIALSSFGASSWTTELVGTPSPLSI
ncbi:uncharacterized protein LOC108602016 [Drosophila busckii]|uniref:uncharacterized protein LOC108602016 n=1 Tax=Drosophila busckii TaxID=30019 RepID=UPI0014329951|nr:uncharacterized protein LOC108602016 [Drosophila busckii]